MNEQNLTNTTLKCRSDESDELSSQGTSSTLSGRGGARKGAGRPKGTTKKVKKKPCSFKLSAEEEKAVRDLLKTMRGK